MNLKVPKNKMIGETISDFVVWYKKNTKCDDLRFVSDHYFQLLWKDFLKKYK